MSEHVEGEVVSAQEGPQEGWLISYVAQRLQVSPRRIRNLIAAGKLHPVPGTSPVRVTEESVQRSRLSAYGRWRKEDRQA